MKAAVLILSLGLASGAVARTYLPSGCSTLTSCEENQDKLGRLQGGQICRNAYKKEIIVIKAHWVDDELHGEFFCANDGGVPRVKAQYKKGLLDGSYQEYDSSLKDWTLEQQFKQGKREGISRRLISDKRSVVRFYKNDKQYGWELLVDAGNKILEKRNCEADNTRHEDQFCDELGVPGYEQQIQSMLAATKKKKQEEDNREVVKKNNKGQVTEKYSLVDGRKHGKYESFYPNGNPETIEEFDHGSKTYQKTFFEEGQVKSETRLKDNRIEMQTIYFQNGKKKSEEKFSWPEKWITTVEYVQYYDNGKVQESGQRHQAATDIYMSGRLDGEIKRFSKEGNLLSISVYDKGQEVGLWKSWLNEYYVEDVYEKGVRTQSTIFDKNTKKQLKKTEYMKDGSVKSEVVDPEYLKRTQKK